MVERIEVYYNLHKHCLSYRPSGGKVKHTQAVILNDVSFDVQPAGNAKVRREGKKNVHAFVRGVPAWISDGSLEDYNSENMERQGYRKITYDPYKNESFVMTDTGAPIKRATQVVITGKNIWLSGQRWA
jgi:hypothetical protein